MTRLEAKHLWLDSVRGIITVSCCVRIGHTIETNWIGVRPASYDRSMTHAEAIIQEGLIQARPGKPYFGIVYDSGRC